VGPRAVMDSGEEKNSQTPLGIDPQNPDCPVPSLVAILTKLSHLPPGWALNFLNGIKMQGITK
jgi:hypothetical protein